MKHYFLFLAYQPYYKKVGLTIQQKLYVMQKGEVKAMCELRTFRYALTSVLQRISDSILIDGSYGRERSLL